jgi:hypothetical protein
MPNPRQALIKAISDLDIDAVEKFMDDEVAHFQGEKSVVIKHLGDFFKWVSESIDHDILGVKEIICESCLHEDGTEVFHKHVVSFCSSSGGFAFDIEPTKNGLFKLDYCNFFDLTEDQTNSDFRRFSMRIPYDQLISFKPDSIYLRLLEEKENMLMEVDNGQIVFWFLDDFSGWFEKYKWAKTTMNENGHGMFAFDNLIHILFRMDFLYEALKNEDQLKLASEKFDKLNHSDVWEIYEWIENYRMEDYTCTSSCELNLDYVNEGYFTFRDFLPNLRFAVFGHSEFLKFLQNKDFAYGVTEEIRKDTLLEDIEDEWHWEEWGEGIHFEFDDDSSED